MSAFADLVRFLPVSSGTGDWVVSSAVGGCQTPALANVQNGVSYKVYAVSTDLTQWEVSQGVYNSGTTTFPRTTVLYNSSGTGTATGQSGAGTKINFSTIPQVSIVAIAEDLISIEIANSFTTAQKLQALTNIAGRLSIVSQTFTSSGTYTPTAGMKFAIIECQGPGGGGGGVAGLAGNSSSGGAGSAGGYSKILVTAAAVGASQVVTVGTGGAGGTAGANAGSNGSGPTSVGTLCVGNAGNGGGGSTSGTNAGTASAGASAGTGDLAAPGSPGFGGYNTTTITVVISGPSGANSFYGAGGLGRSASGTGNNAAGFGSGGAPAVEINNTANAAGGNGAPGIVYIIEYCQI